MNGEPHGGAQASALRAGLPLPTYTQACAAVCRLCHNKDSRIHIATERRGRRRTYS